MRCLLALCVGAAVCFGAIDSARAAETASGSVRLKDLGRFLGRRDNMLVGYGIVTGLSGSGDAPRNQATRQAMQNLLSQFDLVVPVEQIQSRNVAMVMITATLPATANVGDKIDVNVTSTGDARSIAGGTLIMSPLRGPDKRVYALAQGPVTVGGFRFDGNGNLRQKNHPTVGVVSEGGTVEVPVRAELVADNGHLDYILKNADAVTSERIAARINESMGSGAATSLDPETVRIRAPQNPGRLNAFVAFIEGLSVIPDVASRVIINERTGTIAAGGDTRISPITISHGDLRVSIDTEYTASQPNFIGIADDSVRSLIVGNSRLGVEEGDQHVAMSYKQTTVAELVASLAKARVNTRDVISILQAIKAAGALHADLVVQ
ncbi:flagellar basal body P-ring protein FlgI [Lysobacter gummosus]|uniref:Flagellar P-ring protein n=1 Tax=Lysobacter gummosus TaxID=262324 RepID=A0ABY3X8T3_9GAMM|nr:flagellar basal body P-ring protein FlgI [Lysobacter gummosus]UNP28969.1 flagellar basal body P-ring protein FlgI [Lysobacter gummosus]